VDQPALQPGHPHVLPARTLLATAGALVGLTILTVAVSRVDLGDVSVAVALAIAATKAAVVALFFMHLKYTHRFPVVVLVAAALFAVLLVGFVVMDSTQYQPDIRAHEVQPQRAR
jgi:cytochrome c oxidase subunit 4